WILRLGRCSSPIHRLPFPFYVVESLHKKTIRTVKYTKSRIVSAVHYLSNQCNTKKRVACMQSDSSYTCCPDSRYPNCFVKYKLFHFQQMFLEKHLSPMG